MNTSLKEELRKMFRNNHTGFTMRLLALLLAAFLIAGSALAEEDSSGSAKDPFALLEGIDMSLCSGAGAWSTDIQIKADGSFSGTYHDSEMGDAADNYPNGSMYISEFSGKMSVVEQISTGIWKVKVDEVTPKGKTGEETIEDGLRYITCDPYGVTAGDEMMLYQPGTSLDGFSDSMKFWAHVFDAEQQDLTELKDWFLYSSKEDAGFAGVPSGAGTGTAMANPWEDLSLDEVKKLIGVPMNIPEGAEKAICRWYEGEKMAEMQFFWTNGDFCFRAQPVAPRGELIDISGMYYTWKDEEEATVGGCPGTIAQVQSETGDWVQRCLWYDNTTGVSYSLTVVAPDVDGLDLIALAEQIFLPTVG